MPGPEGTHSQVYTVLWSGCQAGEGGGTLTGLPPGCKHLELGSSAQWAGPSPLCAWDAWCLGWPWQGTLCPASKPQSSVVSVTLGVV